MKKLAVAIFLCACAMPAFAGTLQLEGAIEQGSLVRGLTDPGAQVILDGKPVRVAPDGHFIFGLGRDAPPQAALDVKFPDGTGQHRDLAVTAQKYDIQRIDGLPEKQVTPDPETLARIKHDAAAIRDVHATDSDALAFEAPLRWPVAGPISGIYGSQRILNGQPRAPHLGTDIAAPVGTPILAPAAGTVTLAEPDFILDGGTVVIDHGYGLSTLYIHMSKIDVKVGEAVRAGMPIGAVGQTGRATGPHLHWGVNWYGLALDPMLVAGPPPAAPLAQHQ